LLSYMVSPTAGVGRQLWKEQTVLAKVIGRNRDRSRTESSEDGNYTEVATAPQLTPDQKRVQEKFLNRGDKRYLFGLSHLAEWTPLETIPNSSLIGVDRRASAAPKSLFIALRIAALPSGSLHPARPIFIDLPFSATSPRSPPADRRSPPPPEPLRTGDFRRSPASENQAHTHRQNPKRVSSCRTGSLRRTLARS
jgi:hypothetical protein